jgi:hypothetical protein
LNLFLNRTNLFTGTENFDVYKALKDTSFWQHGFSFDDIAWYTLQNDITSAYMQKEIWGWRG